MEVWYNFKNSELVLEPESAFELGFLTDLFNKDMHLECVRYLSETDNSVVAISVKPSTPVADRTDVLSEETIDKMYSELVDEDN